MRIGDNQKVEFVNSFVCLTLPDLLGRAIKNAVAQSIGQYKLTESGNYRNLETGSKKGGAFIGIVYVD